MPQTTAGTKLLISLVAPVTNDLAGYTTLYASMKTVGEIIDLGEYDRVYNLITTNPLGDRRTQKYKGSYNEGTMALSFNIEVGDDGQDDLRTQSKLDADAYFAVVHQDLTVDFFPALVMSASKVIGTVDNMYSSNSSLEINGNIIESPAIP